MKTVPIRAPVSDSYDNCYRLILAAARYASYLIFQLIGFVRDSRQVSIRGTPPPLMAANSARRRVFSAFTWSQFVVCACAVRWQPTGLP